MFHLARRRWLTAALVSIDNKKIRWALSLLIGSSVALSYVNQFTDFWAWSIGEQIFLGLYFVILFTLAAYGLVFYFTWPRLLAFKGWARLLWLVLALLFGGLLIVAIPVEVPLPAAPAPTQHSLEIVATGDSPTQRTVTFPVETLNRLKWNLLTSGLYLAYALSLAVLVLSLTVWLATRRGGSANPVVVSRWAWVYYALTCALVWTVDLLAFWPGAMDYDSLTQWDQMLSGRLVDWHPAFHTMTNWLITRLWFSPAAIALVQIVLLSVIAGWGLARIQRLGAPAGLVWLTCLLFALLPANGSMVITIEKSVLYSIGMLLLTLLILEIVVSQGEWLQKRGAWVIIGTLLALIMLYRANGFTTGLGAVVPLILVYRRRWLTLTAALVLAVGLWLGVRGPLYDWWQVSKIEARGPATAPFIYHIAAHIAGGTSLSSEETAFLSTIHPLDDKWQYDCYSPVPLFFGSNLNWGTVLLNSDKVIRIWWDLTRRNPQVILNHFVCNSTLIWRITRPAATYLYASVIQIDSAGQVHTFINDPLFLQLGLQHQTKLPILEYPLAWWMTRTQALDLSWLIWQPAIYLYLAVIGIIIGTIRLNSWRYLLILTPLALHSLPLLLAVLGRDFRYQYPVYLVGLLVGTLFLVGMPLKRSEA